VPFPFLTLVDVESMFLDFVRLSILYEIRFSMSGGNLLILFAFSIIFYIFLFNCCWTDVCVVCFSMVLLFIFVEFEEIFISLVFLCFLLDVDRFQLESYRFCLFFNVFLLSFVDIG